MATQVDRVTWSFRNVTRSFDFWPSLDSISITDGHPEEQATFSCVVEDTLAALTFANEDVVRVTVDGGAGAVTIFEGPCKVVTLGDHGRSGPRTYSLEGNDWTPLLQDDLVDTAAPWPAESAAARLTRILAFHTKGITVAFSDLPSEDVERQDGPLGSSVLDCLDQFAQELELSYYVDFAKGLHIFRTETISAPFDLISDTPAPPDSYPFWDWTHPQESSELGNAALVIGDKDYGFIVDTGSVATYGRKEFSVQDGTLKSDTAIARAGARALANESQPIITGSLAIAQAGLRAGMTVSIDHHLWPQVLAAAPYIVTSVEIVALDPHDADDTAQIRVTVGYTDRRRPKGKGGRAGGGDASDEDVPGGGGAIGLTLREMLHQQDPLEPNPSLSLVYGNPTTKQIAERIYHNLPYTTVGCPLGTGGWSGWQRREAWYEFDPGALSDDELGLRFTIPAANPADVWGVAGDRLYVYGIAHLQPTDVGQFEALGDVSWVDAGATVVVPAGLLEPNATNYFVIAPGWRSWKNGFYCSQDLLDGAHGPAGAAASGGEGNSGRVVAPVVTARLVMLRGKGLTGWITGLGDVDGSNREFELPGWGGRGVPRVRIGPVELAVGEYSFDEAAGTVTLAHAPEAGDVVTFRFLAGR